MKSKMIRGVAIALSVATASLVATAPASALGVIVDKDQMPGAPTETIHFADGSSENAYFGDQHLTLLGSATSFAAYCLSVFRIQSLSDGGLNQAMTYGPYTDNGSGVPLSTFQIGRVSWLVQNGLHNANAVISAVTQDAIWNVTDGVTFTGLSAPYLAAYNTLISGNQTSSRALSVMIPTTYGQVLTGGVPEPSTWAMFLAGFGMVGYVARRRVGRMQTVSA